MRQVLLVDFHRNPERYTREVYLGNGEILLMSRSGTPLAVLRGAALDTVQRTRAGARSTAPQGALPGPGEGLPAGIGSDAV